MIKYFALLLLISFAIAQAKSGDGKIAGGVPFSIFMAPFQVGVLKNGGGFCGGSIIGPTWILSSAHCLENKAKDSFVVSAGTADLHVPIVIRNVKNIIVHPEFNTTVYLNFDIALLNLDQKLVYSRSIIPIKLVDQNQILTPGTLCKITGWGQSNITIVPDTHLRGTYVELASYECCMSNWGAGITRSMLCTGPLNGQQMSCGGLF